MVDPMIDNTKVFTSHRLILNSIFLKIKANQGPDRKQREMKKQKRRIILRRKRQNQN